MSHGANLESRTLGGETPLMRSIYFGRTQIMKYLIEKGADIDAKSYDGRNVRDYVESTKNDILIETFRGLAN